jgi:hypothetical protein
VERADEFSGFRGADPIMGPVGDTGLGMPCHLFQTRECEHVAPLPEDQA